MITNEFPIKPRRKYVEVPVHKPERDNHHEQHKPKKTYSANFSSRKHRHKYASTDNVCSPKISEVIIEIPEKDSRVSKKTLGKEIQRLTKDNEEISAKFNELEDLSVKKILKLKEKFSNLQDINADVVKENETMRYQYFELQKTYEDIYNQLEISKVCKRCEELREQVEKASQENNILRKRNNDVTEDLGMLKTVVFRLNVQLERYQEKLRKHNISIDKYSHLHSQKSSASQLREDEVINILSSDHQNHRHTPISWGSVNSHTLGPLLDAYQDTINEKDEIIQTYELDFAKFTGRMKDLIEENENLYKKLTEDENCSKKVGTQLEHVRSELKLTKDQNDALIKKCAIKQDKIEEILKIYENKEDMSGFRRPSLHCNIWRKSACPVLVSFGHEPISEILKKVNHEKVNQKYIFCILVDQMKRDYQVVHEEYIKLRTENVSLKDKIKSLIDSQDDFKNERQNYIPISVHTASVNECKKWYEELKVQYESEKLKLKENNDTQKKEINELHNRITSIKTSKEVLEEKIVKLGKELKKYESKQLDLEHTLNEVQLSRSACRKQLHKAMCFAKDMVAEQETLLRALNQRQLENRAVKKIGSEMAFRMDTLKSQLKDVQKSAWQEFSTVEQRIHEQADLIEAMKDDHNKEIEKLKQIITEQEDKLSIQKEDKHVHMSQYQLFKEKYK